MAGGGGYNNMTFAQLMEERESIINKENIITSLVNGDISKLNNLDSKKLKELSNTRKKIQLHVQRNLAQAYSVLALSIIAIPLSLRIGRKESYLNALIALFIALLYHFLFILMSWFDDFSNFRSDLLVWFPNILYQSIGMWLFAKEAKK